MAGIAEVGAKDGKKPEKEQSKVTIYFGVFFDGTNNHRLQVLIGKKYREKKNKKAELSIDEKEVAQQFNFDIEKSDEIDRAKENISHAQQSLDNCLESINHALPQAAYSCYLLKKNIEESSEEIKKYEGIKETNSDNFDSDFFYKDEYNNNDKIGILSDGERKQQDVQVNDFTNIAILEPFYQGKNSNSITSNEYVYRLYVTGSGTSRDITQGENTNGLGFGVGETGVVQKVIDAITGIDFILMDFVDANKINLVFHVFGFSRGATEARIFINAVKRDKQIDELSKFIIKGKNELQKIDPKNITIEAVGLYDTVSSVGIMGNKDYKKDYTGKFISNIGKAGLSMSDIWAKYLSSTHEKVWSKRHESNVSDLGLNKFVRKSKKILHLCALDEFRENFALIPVPLNMGNVTELLIPGAHADVGGGYPSGDDCVKLDLNALKNCKLPCYPLKDVKTADFSLLYDKIKPEESGLFKHGWLKARDIIELKSNGDLHITRQGIKKDYCYIGLHLMGEWGKEIFKGEDLHNKFMISDEILKKFKENLDKNINSKGRFSIYPQNLLEYQYLRRYYLHFSTNYVKKYKCAEVNTPRIVFEEDRYFFKRMEYSDELKISSL